MPDYEHLAQAMNRDGLDGLIALGIKNAMYLGNHVDFERWESGPDALAGLVTVMIPTGTSFKISGLNEPAPFPGETYDCDHLLSSRVRMVADELKKRRLDHVRIGIDLDHSPASAVDYLRGALPNCEFVAADVLILQMRAKKSLTEISYIREAVHIAEESVH